MGSTILPEHPHPFRFAIHICHCPECHAPRRCAWPADQNPRLRLLGEIFAGVLERKRARMELEAQLSFKELLSRVSAALIDLPPELLDAEIEGCLGKCSVSSGLIVVQ